MTEETLDWWRSRARAFLLPYLERKGDVVQDLALTTKGVVGRAKFKTKRGVVTVLIDSKGVRLGIPGQD